MICAQEPVVIEEVYCFHFYELRIYNSVLNKIVGYLSYHMSFSAGDCWKPDVRLNKA